MMFKEGYRQACEQFASQQGVQTGLEYINGIETAIDELNQAMNSIAGSMKSSGTLQGDLAEFWHGGTFNIKAAVEDSSYRVNVDRSHDYASADLRGNWDEAFGLKYYKTAASSANAQSVSHFQRFCEYKSQSGNYDMEFEEFLAKRNLSDVNILNDPIYSGQTRIIPADQYNAAIEYLKLKIAKESMTRPELANSYQDTLNALSQSVKAPDGTSSMELTREASEQLAEIARRGEFEAAALGLSVDQLVHLRHILNQGLKAGFSAAVITMVLKMGPEIIRGLQELLNTGTISKTSLKEIGKAGAKGAGAGFAQGFMAGSLTVALERAGVGITSNSVTPSIVGALVAITLQTMQDSISLANGEISKRELCENLSRNIFTVAAGIGGGVLMQTFVPIPFSYLIGSFIGSVLGTMVYGVADSILISLAVDKGWTFFGIVNQNYQLPDELLNELGIETYQPDYFQPDEFEADEFEIDEFEPDCYEPELERMLERGYIGLHKVSYKYF